MTPGSNILRCVGNTPQAFIAIRHQLLKTIASRSPYSFIADSSINSMYLWQPLQGLRGGGSGLSISKTRFRPMGWG